MEKQAICITMIPTTSEKGREGHVCEREKGRKRREGKCVSGLLRR